MADPSDKFELETLAIHAAQPPDPSTGAVVPPLHLSTTFAQEGPGRHSGFEYARTDNPTRRSLERCVASLERGEEGIAFASGCAATMALLQTLSPGDHLVCCDDVYGGTYRIMEQIVAPLGITVDRIDMTQLRQLESALRDNTKMIWVETPTNPLLKLIDIKALSWAAGTRGACLVVDNTFATPVLQQPLELGATAVVHSSTKYLNGHCDVVGGMVVTSDEVLGRRLRFLQNAAGAVPSPFDCYMVLRGLKTLPLRMQRHCETASALASFLFGHAAIERVIYPGLGDHPQKALADRQMRLPGGMISIVLAGGRAAAERMLQEVSLFTCAESLGGVESLIEHPASMTHAAVPPEVRAELGIEDGLVRLSVGLEAEADLCRDLAQAL